MSENGPCVKSTPSGSVETTESPVLHRCASYLGCRYCEEGALVYDSKAGASRCRNCGELE